MRKLLIALVIVFGSVSLSTYESYFQTSVGAQEEGKPEKDEGLQTFNPCSLFPLSPDCTNEENVNSSPGHQFDPCLLFSNSPDCANRVETGVEDQGILPSENEILFSGVDISGAMLVTSIDFSQVQPVDNEAMSTPEQETVLPDTNTSSNATGQRACNVRSTAAGTSVDFRVVTEPPVDGVDPVDAVLPSNGTNYRWYQIGEGEWVAHICFSPNLPGPDQQTFGATSMGGERRDMTSHGETDGNGGIYVAFSAGESVVGSFIRLDDGQEANNCFIASAPNSGSVYGGVVNPWDGEQGGNVCNFSNSQDQFQPEQQSHSQQTSSNDNSLDDDDRDDAPQQPSDEGGNEGIGAGGGEQQPERRDVSNFGQTDENGNVYVEFGQGEEVTGAYIVYDDGSVCEANCHTDSADQGGRVYGGVVNPWEGE